MRIILKRLPRRASLGLGAAVGLVAYGLGIRRGVVMENLARAFPERSMAERRWIARGSYRNLGRMAAEWLVLDSITPEEIDRLVEGIDGREYMETVGAKGSGLVVVTGHVGNWELMGAYFARLGYRLKVIAKPVHNERIEAFVAGTRRACGFDILYTGESLKSGLRHLKEGGVLAIVADQDARKDGIPVPFFGHEASTALGPAVFAYLGKTPILPVFTLRVGGLRHRFCLYPPIYPPESGSREERLEAMTRAHVEALEAFIRQHPDQYFWFHRRWKTPPEKLRRAK